MYFLSYLNEKNHNKYLKTKVTSNRSEMNALVHYIV